MQVPVFCLQKEPRQARPVALHQPEREQLVTGFRLMIQPHPGAAGREGQTHEAPAAQSSPQSRLDGSTSFMLGSQPALPSPSLRKELQ